MWNQMWHIYQNSTLNLPYLISRKIWVKNSSFSTLCWFNIKYMLHYSSNTISGELECILAFDTFSSQGKTNKYLHFRLEGKSKNAEKIDILFLRIQCQIDMYENSNSNSDTYIVDSNFKSKLQILSWNEWFAYLCNLPEGLLDMY